MGKNEIQLTKNKIDLKNRKMTNHPPLTGQFPPKNASNSSVRK